jgi:hypothetical protein
MSIQIKLIRKSMNTDWTRAYGLVFKLQYYFPKPDQPHLEVFFHDGIARSEQWEIYGVPWSYRLQRHPNSIARFLEFENLGQAKHFQLGREFQIEFTAIGEEEVHYRRTGKKIEPTYHFRVTQIGEIGDLA